MVATDEDEGVDMRLDYASEPAWGRVSNRAWNGSSRSGGGRKARGSITLPNPAAVKLVQQAVCSCGRPKVSCRDCGELWCDAPGHQRHACGGAR